MNTERRRIEKNVFYFYIVLQMRKELCFLCSQNKLQVRFLPEVDASRNGGCVCHHEAPSSSGFFLSVSVKKMTRVRSDIFIHKDLLGVTFDEMKLNQIVRICLWKHRSFHLFVIFYCECCV